MSSAVAEPKEPTNLENNSEIVYDIQVGDEISISYPVNIVNGKLNVVENTKATITIKRNDKTHILGFAIDVLALIGKLGTAVSNGESVGEMANLSETVAQINTKINTEEELRNTIAELNAAIAAAIAENEKINTEKAAELAAMQQTHQAEIEKANLGLEQAKTDADTAKKALLDENERLKAENGSKITELEENLEKLKTELQKQQSDVMNAKTEYEKKEQTEYADLQKQYDVASKELKQLTSKQTELDTVAKSATDLLEKQKISLTELEKQNKLLIKEKEDIEKVKNTDLDRLTAQLEKLENSNKDFDAKVLELEKAKTQLDGRITNLISENSPKGNMAVIQYDIPKPVELQQIQTNLSGLRTKMDKITNTTFNRIHNRSNQEGGYNNTITAGAGATDTPQIQALNMATELFNINKSIIRLPLIMRILSVGDIKLTQGGLSSFATTKINDLKKLLYFDNANDTKLFADPFMGILSKNNNIHNLFKKFTENSAPIRLDQLSFVLLYLIYSNQKQTQDAFVSGGSKPLLVLLQELTTYVDTKIIDTWFNETSFSGKNITLYDTIDAGFSTDYTKAHNAENDVLTFVRMRGDGVGKIATDINRRFRVAPITSTERQTQQYVRSDYDDSSTPLYIEGKATSGSPIYNRTYQFGPFTGIFTPDMTNSDIMDTHEMQMVADKLINGNPVCVIGYGRSGSGKTSTLVYLDTKNIKLDVNIKPEDQNGILMLLSNIMGEKGFTSCSITPYEIYLEELVNPNPTAVNFNYTNTSKMWVLSPPSSSGGSADVYQHNINIAEPKSTYNSGGVAESKNSGESDDTKKYMTHQILEMLKIRKVSNTPNNPESSRSHLILVINYTKPDKINSGTTSQDEVKSSTLVLCDFAGVENKFDCKNDEVRTKFQLKDPADTSKFVNTELETLRTEFETKKQRLEAEIKQMGESNKQIEAEIAQLETEKSKIDSDITPVQAEIDKLNAQLGSESAKTTLFNLCKLQVNTTTITNLNALNTAINIKIDNLIDNKKISKTRTNFDVGKALNTLYGYNINGELIGKNNKSCALNKIEKNTVFSSYANVCEYNLKSGNSVPQKDNNTELNNIAGVLNIIWDNIKLNSITNGGNSIYVWYMLELFKKMGQDDYTNLAQIHLNYILNSNTAAKQLYDQLKTQTNTPSLSEAEKTKIQGSLNTLKTELQEKQTQIAEIQTQINTKQQQPTDGLKNQLTELKINYETNITNITTAECKVRTDEGSYINKHLFDLRKFIGQLILQGSSSKMPKFIDMCAPLQCDPNFNTCFGKNDYPTNIKDLQTGIPNVETSKLAETILSKSKLTNTDDYNKMTFCIFTVINLSKFEVDPPNPPYIDITTLQSLYETNANPLITISDKNITAIHDAVTDMSENKILKSYGDTNAVNDIIATCNLVIITTAQSAKMAHLKILIEKIDNINALTTIGSLQFTDTMAKFGMNTMVCNTFKKDGFGVGPNAIADEKNTNEKKQEKSDKLQTKKGSA